METLAPALELVLEVRFAIEKGESLKRTLWNYIGQNSIQSWCDILRIWLQMLETGRSPENILQKRSFAERRVLELLEQGLRGESIFSQLCSLEEELFEASRLEMEGFVATLSVKALIPLLFFQFPAFLLLLFGPFLTQFMHLS